MRGSLERSITKSIWHREYPNRQRFDRINDNAETDILVIGAGITGLTAAIELAERGHRVILCEAETIGAGTTAASTGHLDAHPETRATDYLLKLGETTARQHTDLRLDAIDRIEKLACPRCDFRRIPAYQYCELESERVELEKDYEAAVKLGLQASWLENIPIPNAKCGYQVSSMARIDCGSYLRQLTDVAVDRGVLIFEKTLVAGPTEEHPTSLKAGDWEIRFKHVVCAVHCNYTDSLTLYAATPAYQTYVIAAKVMQPPADALFWDNSDPYYYTRRLKSGDPSIVLVGGRDHRTGAGQETERLQELETWLHGRFQVSEILERWSGEFFEPVDDFPMIGKVAGKENVWIVTGLSGMGLTWGTAAATLIADAIAGEPHAVMKSLQPSRTGLSSPLVWLGEQATTVANYANRVMPSSKIDLDELESGKGTVGNLDGKYMAICRDQDGCEHRLSPICPHMGGVLHWNEVEQTWDCPVHGGRFTAAGKRIYGPPEIDMQQISAEAVSS